MKILEPILDEAVSVLISDGVSLSGSVGGGAEAAADERRDGERAMFPPLSCSTRSKISATLDRTDAISVSDETFDRL
jgi:hypothetical protein